MQHSMGVFSIVVWNMYDCTAVISKVLHTTEASCGGWVLNFLFLPGPQRWRNWLQWTRTPHCTQVTITFLYQLPLKSSLRILRGPHGLKFMGFPAQCHSHQRFCNFKDTSGLRLQFPFRRVSAWDGNFSSLEFAFCCSLAFLSPLSCLKVAHSPLLVQACWLALYCSFLLPPPPASGCPIPGHLASRHILSSKCVYNGTK